MRTGVAIALYNGIHFLKEQIDSLLAQTMLPDLIVCCDDGSSDGTIEWLKEYVQKRGCSDRFLLIENDVRLGYAQNFYKALDLCDTDLLFLCDQDDIWDPEKIRKMTEIFEKNQNIDLLACAHTLINASGAPVSSLRYAQKTGSGSLTFLTAHDIVTRFNWPGMTLALRRTLWDEIKDTAKVIQAPHDRVLSLFAASKKAMAYFDLPLCAHRFHNSNSGGEENDSSAYLRRAFKAKELSTSLQWLSAQLVHASSFSADAQKALTGYKKYIQYRCEAVSSRKIRPLFKALQCKGYINLKGIIADFVSIVLNK